MILAAALGGLVGIILALTGAGGAIIAVPLLMFGFHWDVAHAAPVALLAVGSSAAVGAVMGLKARVVRYRAALLMAAVGSVVTPLGVMVAHRLPSAPLSLIFAATLMLVAQRMYRQARRQLRGLPDVEVSMHGAACKLDQQAGRLRWNAPCARALAQAGLVTGFLSGLLGVGGGFVIVPALRRSTDLPMNSIVGTSLMVVALVSVSAVSTAALAGHFDFAVAAPFAGGSIAAMLAGRKIAARLAGPQLQQGFAAIAALVAIGLVVKVFG